MNVYKIIQKFVKDKHYEQDEHVLGILFYGSSKYGLNNSNSDIDLLIVYDNLDNQNSLIRGNAIVDDTRIEYFTKTIREIHINVEEDFISIIKVMNYKSIGETTLGKNYKNTEGIFL